MSGEELYDEESEDIEEDVDGELDNDIAADAGADDDADADSSDNVGDMSVEINVEEIVAKIEKDDAGEAARKREVRRRLDEVQEEQRAARELDSTYNFNFDDEL